MPDATAARRALEHPGTRLAGFGGILAAVLLAGYGLGRLNTGPVPGRDATVPAAAGPGGHAAGTDDHAAPAADGHDHGGAAPAGPAAVTRAAGGLAVTDAGLTLVPRTTTFTAGRTTDLQFTVTGPGGVPVTAFQPVHDRPLHLVVVRRDLTGYQHLHPTMAPDGTWRVPLRLDGPGSYRAVADFTALVAGRPTATTLGVDLSVPGASSPAPLPPAGRTADADGLRIAWEGTPRVGTTTPVLVDVTGPDGRPAALQPYLGAYGHLVVLRAGDVGYVHVHPEPELVDGRVRFWLAAPGPGSYRMFVEVQVAGRVHTAAYTLTVP